MTVNKQSPQMILGRGTIKDERINITLHRLACHKKRKPVKYQPGMLNINASLLYTLVVISAAYSQLAHAWASGNIVLDCASHWLQISLLVEPLQEVGCLKE